MSKKVNTPGVYIEEVPSPVSIAQVPTSIPAFIGFTEVIPQPNLPTKISSLTEFQQLFGGAAEVKNPNGGVENEELSGIENSFNLYPSLRLFFANGGEVCYIVSIGNYENPEAMASRSFLEGLDRLRTVEEVRLLVFPDAVNLDANALGHVQQQALAQCAELKDRFCILDLRQEGGADLETNCAQFRTAIGNRNLSYGAAYYPYLQMEIDPQTGRKASLPASGAIAGIYASVDASRGVWKAPANISINGISGLTAAISDHEQEGMNVHHSGKSINAIREFPEKGILVWGARTLDANNNEWRYVNVRRLGIMIDTAVKEACLKLVSEPNTAPTWDKVKAIIEDYLNGLWRKGAFVGGKPEESYFVRIGLKQTMTRTDLDNDLMIVELGFAPMRPAEFVILRHTQQQQAPGNQKKTLRKLRPIFRRLR